MLCRVERGEFLNLCPSPERLRQLPADRLAMRTCVAARALLPLAYYNSFQA